MDRWCWWRREWWSSQWSTGFLRSCQHCRRFLILRMIVEWGRQQVEWERWGWWGQCYHCRQCTGYHRSSSPSLKILFTNSSWPLHMIPGADSVVSVWELETRGVVVVEWLNSASNSCEVLQTSSSSWNKMLLMMMLMMIALPLDKELHSIWVILTENVLENDGPAVTTVMTTGLLLDSPMSTYTRTHITI